MERWHYAEASQLIVVEATVDVEYEQDGDALQELEPVEVERAERTVVVGERQGERGGVICIRVIVLVIN